MERIGLLLVVVLVGAGGEAQARPMKCNTAVSLTRSDTCKENPKWSVCKDASKRAAEEICKKEVGFAAMSAYRVDCAPWCKIDTCVLSLRPGRWAKFWNILWTPQECEDECDTCNSDGADDGAIHLRRSKTGALMTPHSDLQASVDVKGPCEMAKEDVDRECAASKIWTAEQKKKCEDARAARDLACGPRMTASLLWGNAWAEEAESTCPGAVDRATSCHEGDPCKEVRARVEARARVVRACPYDEIQRWFVNNFMMKQHEDLPLPKSVDAFMQWLKEKGSKRDCQLLVGFYGWASNIPYEFLGYPEVSVPWRKAGYDLSQRIKKGACRGRWEE